MSVSEDFCLTIYGVGVVVPLLEGDQCCRAAAVPGVPGTLLSVSEWCGQEGFSLPVILFRVGRFFVRRNPDEPPVYCSLSYRYRWRLRHILVDEYQDTSPAQQRLLQVRLFTTHGFATY